MTRLSRMTRTLRPPRSPLVDMPKYRLLTPGPTEVPQQARLALARQIVHHRTPEFRKLLAEVLEGLQYVFQTQNDVVLLTSSGTGAMEAAVVNLVPRGGKAIVLESGKFSERWRLIAEKFGIEVVRHEVPWGDAFKPGDVARLLSQHPDAVAVYTTLSESSTGVGHDIEAIGRVVAPTPALLVVDAISGAGAMPCRTDAWGIDVLVVGSQKALMGPPGLALLAVSPRGLEADRVDPAPGLLFRSFGLPQGTRGTRYALHAGHSAGGRPGRDAPHDPRRRDRERLGPDGHVGPGDAGGDRGPGDEARGVPAGG